MAEQPFVDYYAALDITAGASTELIAAAVSIKKRLYGAEGPDGGDPRLAALITAAEKTLTDPVQRPRYDTYHAKGKPTGSDDPGDLLELQADRAMRRRIMLTLYKSRRKDGPKGIGDYTMEQTIGISMDELQFHMWYLSAKGWIARTDKGQLTITVEGIDQLA